MILSILIIVISLFIIGINIKMIANLILEGRK